ncbi:RepB family plasmid replication initiator protein (plasmid) [Acinetobacter haemolyticus]|uniref:replication initiation protein RepM n=1 Tax=Acinetobacter haemolyticus TaxID=29430 RepID=UPI001331DC99|nr:replication initiation protein RepM [Acinetobacter haemolyticus]QHI24745.1 RepB family plasmid replication initiator protein [Acinetobacter haemolyticus]
MKNSLVVKDNALINASYNLELTEQRLIMLAIINARESGQGITADSKLEIHASDYAKLFSVSIDASYKALKEAVNNLFNRQFSYTAKYKRTGKTGVVRSRWVSRIFYVDDLALLEITFAPDVVPLVTRLEEHFTSYQAKQVAHLTSKYATRLYELLIAWRETGKVPQIEIGEFRNRLGLLDNEYTAMSDFKKRVLESSIKQINEHTDITVTYEQHKKGRVISGFSFKLKQKQQAKQVESNRDQNTADIFTKMTDAQRHMFAHKLARDERIESEYSHLIGSGTYEQFAKKLAEMMQNEAHFSNFLPILKEYGFKP